MLLKRFIHKLLMYLCGLMLLFSMPVYADAQNQSLQKALVVSKVSHNPKKHYNYLKPMADFLANEMQDLGYTHGEVLMAKDNQQMIEYLKQGKVDLVTETAFSAMFFHQQAGAEPILRKWKKGVPSYYTVIFVHRNSEIQSLSDLRGKVIAFEDPGSTSAFYMPAAALLEADLKLQLLASPRDKPATDQVGYVFSREELNTSIWVHKGIVAAGAFSNLDWGKTDHMPAELHDDLRIIYQTNPIPRAIELVRKDLPTNTKNRLKEIMLDMHNNPEVEQVLRSYQKTKKFDVLTDEIWEQLYQAKNILEAVDKELK